VDDVARDRVGIGWRPELAADIHLAIERFDVLEVVADNWFRASRRDSALLASLARDVPLILHGVGMGLASAARADDTRIEAMARLVARVEPESWSEHLAFVRAGGIEIGHLCAPPRCAETIDGAARNIRRASVVVGAPPAMENVATLLDPPASTLDEPDWTARIVAGAGVPVLLDLHNLLANAFNLGRDPVAYLDAMPLARVTHVHLSGGRVVRSADGTRRILDDHLHDPPEAVFELLERLAARARRPLTVVLERDGAYPALSVLAAQVERARGALARGRAAAAATGSRAPLPAAVGLSAGAA
jgi:uncharacterized protein